MEEKLGKLSNVKNWSQDLSADLLIAEHQLFSWHPGHFPSHAAHQPPSRPAVL